MRASRLSRRTWLWIAGVATVALGTIELALNQRMMDTAGPGIIGFEFAGTEDNAKEILADWGGEGQDAARLALWLDFPYLVAYGALGWLGIRAIRDAALRRGWRRVANFAGPTSALVLLAAGFDAVENVGLLLALEEIGGGVGSGIAAGCAVFKFQFAVIVLLYLLAALLTWTFARAEPEPASDELIEEQVEAAPTREEPGEARPTPEPAPSPERAPTPEPTPEHRSPYEPPPGPPPPGAPEAPPPDTEEPAPAAPEERPAERPRRRWIR
jgi:hypothetical protein